MRERSARFDLERALRPALRGLRSYEPIEPPEEVAARYGVAPEAIVKLDGNENPVRPLAARAGRPRRRAGGAPLPRPGAAPPARGAGAAARRGGRSASSPGPAPTS